MTTDRGRSGPPAQRRGSGSAAHGGGTGARLWREPRHRHIAVAVAAVVLVGVGAWWLLRPRTPEAVFADAVDALKAGDCDALVGLAHPEELRRLHVTPAAVRGVLDETLWARGRPSIAGWEPDPPERYARKDKRAWYIRFAGDDPNDERLSLPVVLLDSPDRGWCLCLTELLRLACSRARYLADGRSGSGIRETFPRHGITGLRLTNGGWEVFAPAPALD